MTVGNRNEPRLRTRLRARMIAKFGESRVVLVNLSTRGCCLEGAEPENGRNVILQWEAFEAFGETLWSNEGMTGIRFDRPIPYEWVIATREAAANALPVGKIHDARESARAWSQGMRPV